MKTGWKTPHTESFALTQNPLPLLSPFRLENNGRCTRVDRTNAASAGTEQIAGDLSSGGGGTPKSSTASHIPPAHHNSAAIYTQSAPLRRLPTSALDGEIAASGTMIPYKATKGTQCNPDQLPVSEESFLFWQLFDMHNPGPTCPELSLRRRGSVKRFGAKQHDLGKIAYDNTYGVCYTGRSTYASYKNRPFSPSLSPTSSLPCPFLVPFLCAPKMDSQTRKQSKRRHRRPARTSDSSPKSRSSANNNSSHPLFLPTLHFQIADLKKFSWLHFDEKSGVDRVKSNNKRRPSVDSESSVEGSLMIKTKPTSIQPQPLKSSLRNTRPPRKTVRFDIDDHDQSGRTATTSHQRTKTLPQMTPINTFSQMPSIEEDPISPLSPVYPPDPDRLLQFLRACQDDTPLTPSPPTPATPATPTTRSPHSPKPVNLYMQTWLNALDDAAKNTRSARLYGTLPTDFGRQNKAATLSAMLTNRRFSADAVNPRVSDVLLPTSPGHQRNHSAPLSIPKQQEAFDRNMARIQQQQSRNQTPPLVRQDLCEDTDWDDEDELEDDLEDETSSNLKIYGPFKSEAEADLFLDLISDSPTMLSNPTFVI